MGCVDIVICMTFCCKIKVSGCGLSYWASVAHGVAFGDPDILYRWRRWYNVSDSVDEQGEQYTLEDFGAEELARMEEQMEQ
jgi:hypothetical protein